MCVLVCLYIYMSAFACVYLYADVCVLCLRVRASILNLRGLGICAPQHSGTPVLPLKHEDNSLVRNAIYEWTRCQF